MKPGDQVLDIGCGRGAAVDEAARRGAAVIGVDHSLLMRMLARYLAGPRSGRDIVFKRWKPETEQLPVKERVVTVAWAIRPTRRCADIEARLSELHRVLKPGGTLIIAERQARPGARGRAAHGFDEGRVDTIVTQAQTVGFATAEHFTCYRVGQRRLAVVCAHRADEPG